MFGARSTKEAVHFSSSNGICRGVDLTLLGQNKSGWRRRLTAQGQEHVGSFSVAIGLGVRRNALSRALDTARDEAETTLFFNAGV